MAVPHGRDPVLGPVGVLVSSLPGWMLQHSITVEALTGQSAYGPVYAEPVAVQCFLDYATRLVRQPGADQVTSSSTAYCRLADIPAPATGSRVTLPDGRVTTVVAALRRDGGGMATPDHLEIQLL